MPEETEDYIRIPVSTGHKDHRIRTKTISAKEGIKALYCGECEEIVTYLFEKAEDWTMEKANDWVKEHKDGKSLDLRSAKKAEELSFSDIDQQVWSALNPNPSPEGDARREYPTDIKVYDDHITYGKGGSAWTCTYTIQEGKVVLGEPVEGQFVFQPLGQRSAEANTAIKSLGNGRIGGYLMVWGNPTLKDLENTYFAPDTELCLDWFSQRPILYEHGQDGAIKLSSMGQFTTEDMKADQVGMWIEGQLDARKRYLAAVEKLIGMGVLNWSSRSLPDLMEIASDGKITKWPLIEATMTTHPAELRFTDVQSMKAFFQEAGLELPQRFIAGAQGVADPGGSGPAGGVELRRRRLRLLGARLGITSKGD